MSAAESSNATNDISAYTNAEVLWFATYVWGLRGPHIFKVASAPAKDCNLCHTNFTEKWQAVHYARSLNAESMGRCWRQYIRDANKNNPDSLTAKSRPILEACGVW